MSHLEEFYHVKCFELISCITEIKQSIHGDSIPTTFQIKKKDHNLLLPLAKMRINSKLFSVLLPHAAGM